MPIHTWVVKLKKLIVANPVAYPGIYSILADVTRAGTIVPISQLSAIPHAVLEAVPPVDRYSYLDVRVAPYEQVGVRRLGYRFKTDIY